MKVYETKNVRNVVLLGHGGVGKSTIIEAMAYVTGLIGRMGRIDDGNTISDFDKEEIKRKFSIAATVVPIEFEDIKVNFIDTPGYFDFTGEVVEAIAAADAAIIVIDAKSGVQVGAEKAWDYCEKYNIPRMIFVNGMDDDQASFRQVNIALNEKFGRKIAPFHVPMRENGQFVGFVNIVKMSGRHFIDSFKYEECEIPEYLTEHVNSARESLMEAVAETSEEFMDRYFSGDEFTYEEVSSTLRANVMTGEIVPVLMGSALNAQGMNMMLTAIKKYFPSPDQTVLHAHDINTGELINLKYDEASHISFKVFKTIVDPFIGKYSLIKVCTGCLKPGMNIYNLTEDVEDKIGKIYLLRGKEAMEVSELQAGDIGALTKMNVIKTGDTFADKGATAVYDAPDIPTPYTYKAFKSVNKGDEDKISTALSKIMDEDPTIKVVNDSENRQTLLYGMGDQHLDIVVSKLSSRYKAEIVLSAPKFAYRETIRKKVIGVNGTHKKQSGGHGQYGVVIMNFEPLEDMEKSYEFEQVVVGGSVPKNFFPAVEKGIAESVLKGPLAGYPVVGIKATLTDGKYHPVDSSEMAFKTAAINAFKAGVMDAQPVLLEPIANLRVTIPNRFAGDVMGDLNKRRGRVLGSDHIEGGKQVIIADIPMSELFGYSTDLRSMTGGIGDYSYEFVRYEQCPGDVQKKEIEARKAEEE